MWVVWSAFLIVMLFVLGTTLAWSLSNLPPTEAVAVSVIVLLASLCVVQGVAIFFDVTNRGDKERIFRDWATIALLALAFSATIVQTVIFSHQLGISQSSDKTFKDTLVATNRAWMAVSHVDFLRQPDATGEGPLIMAFFRNVGRFPALDVRNDGGWFVMPVTSVAKLSPMPDTGSWLFVDQIVRRTCSGLQPSPGQNVVFPFTEREGNYELSDPDPMPDVAAIAKSQNQLIVADGCMSYRTFEDVHHTGFCQFATNRRTGKWEFLSCPAANFAD